MQLNIQLNWRGGVQKLKGDFFLASSALVKSFGFGMDYQRLMMQLCEECILNRDMPTLREIILKFAYFQELADQLTEHQFGQLLSRISFEIIVRRQPLPLEVDILYFFLEAGLIRKREIGGKSSKSIRSNKNKSWITTTSKMGSRVEEFKGTLLCQIEQYDSFEEMQTNKGRYVQNVYQNYSGRPAIALTLALEDIPECVSSKIRQMDQQKVKMLCECMQIRGIQRSGIAEKIHKFKFLRLKFGQILYGRGVRPDHVFFIKNGSVEVFPGGKRASSFVVGRKTMLGIHKRLLQCVRCVSDKVDCYAIKTDDLRSYFPNLEEISLHQLSPTAEETTIPPLIRSPFGSTHSNGACVGSVSAISLASQSGLKRQQRKTRGRCLHVSMQSLGSSNQSNSRVELLRRRLPNYYNQLYGEYSERKIKQMGLTPDNQENLILYDIKVLEKKPPVMEEIRAKLKKRRVDKIIHCMERIRGVGHAKHLSGGVDPLPGPNS